MAFFTCPDQNCGRKFKDEKLFEDHMRRRHPKIQENLKDISNFQNITTSDTTNDTFNELQKEHDSEQKEKELQEEFKKLDKMEEESIKITTQDIMNSRQKLTEEYILTKSGSDSLDDITHVIKIFGPNLIPISVKLVLREENLYVFDDTPGLSIFKLANIEFLSLSHNRIANLIGVSKLAELIELNINFNIVEDLSPLSCCLNLQRLFASNNRIKTIAPLKELGRLQTLSVYRNRVSNLQESVQVLNMLYELNELDFDGNPVEKLDGEKVSEIDYELARSFKKESLDPYTSEQNTGTLQRPSTAPGRTKKSSFVGKLKGDVIQYSKRNPLNTIVENVNSEQLEELEQENKNLKIENAELIQELESIKTDFEILKLHYDKMQNENLVLKAEANSAYVLMDQNKQLRKELETLKPASKNDISIMSKSLTGFGRDPKEEIAFLNKKIEEILLENAELRKRAEKAEKFVENSKNIDGRLPPTERQTRTPTLIIKRNSGATTPTSVRRVVRGQKRQKINKRSYLSK